MSTYNDYIRNKLSLFTQLFETGHVFADLAYSMLDEEDDSMCYFLDSWIDDKFTSEFSEFGWEECSRMRYSTMTDREFVEYAEELGIPISQEVLDEMLVID